MRLPLLLLVFLVRESSGFAPQQLAASCSSSSSELASTKQRWGKLDGKIRERMGKARDGSPRYQQKESKEDKKRRMFVVVVVFQCTVNHHVCSDLNPSHHSLLLVIHIHTHTGQLLFMQQKQAEKKKAARIYRPLNFQSRLPLSQLLSLIHI